MTSSGSARLVKSTLPACPVPAGNHDPDHRARCGCRPLQRTRARWRACSFSSHSPFPIKHCSFLRQKRGIIPSIGMHRTFGGRNRRAIHIRRREFIFTLGSAALAWPLMARAQQPKVPTIGALVIGNISPEEFWREFRQGLRDLGYIEGQNIRFEFRSAEGQIDRLPELAAQLFLLKFDVIVLWSTPTALAAKQATHEIPIVMAETGDPVGTGLVASLPQPGGNVTGIAAVTAELAGKSIQLIRDMLPSARRVTALANATDPFSKPFLEQIQLGGEATGTAINPIRINNNEEFE